MSKDSEASPPRGQFLVYQAEDGKLKIDVQFEGETVWLTQQHMAELFQTTKQNIGQHLKSIFTEGELIQDSVVKDSFTTAAAGKNYLSEPELEALNNLVEQYLIFAQGQAMRRVPMHMADWIEKLNGFLTLNDRDILTHAGRISHEMAQAKAEMEYDKFKALTASAPRAVDADFEQATKDLKKLPKPPRKKKP
jgi:hypothetical protein